MAHFVIEADGGSRGNPGPAAYGTVVRDGETGQVLVERAEYLGTATNNVAEYHGLIAGLTAVRELDPDATVEARLDSKLVVEQMSGRWKIKHPSMRPLALQAQAILPPGRVSYVWVPRERNKHADRLANEALDAAALGEAWSAGASTAELRAADDGALFETRVDETRVDDARVDDARVDEAEVEPAPATATRTLVGWDTDLAAPTTLLLLRHGETAHTVEKRFSGAGGEDPPLSEEGRRQAQAAAQRLATRGGVDMVLSSPLRRARETAEVVSEALGVTVREADGFRECAFGEWEGLTFEEVRASAPDVLTAWLADSSLAPPGGESFEDVRRRVRRARDQLLARYPGRTVLVVTHVTPIKLLCAEALGAPLAAIYRMELSPATLSEVQYFGGGQTSLRRFNDAAHVTG